SETSPLSLHDALPICAAAMVPAGYVGALFIPSGRWYVRATVLVAAFVIGVVWPARSSKRFCGIVVLSTAVAIGVLTIVASKHPRSEEHTSELQSLAYL